MKALAACWICTVAGGLLLLGTYAARPGASGPAPDNWPLGTSLHRDASRPTLLIFLHPRCPCTRASLAELNRILSYCQGRVSACAVVYRPDRPNESWSQFNLVTEQIFSFMPIVSVHDDPGGAEARRFGVATSGHVLLFDRSGRRIFTGGITPSRGHEGANRGADDVASRLLNRDEDAVCSTRPDAPVFGCPIIITNNLDAEDSKE